MILFCDKDTAKECISSGRLNPDTTLLFCLTSPVEGIPRLNILPQGNLYDPNGSTNDMIYNYIFGNSYILVEFFKNVMYPAYAGLDVVILISKINSAMETITDSVMKAIQQRYFYNPLLINEPEDLDYVNKDMAFNIMGIYNFDRDKEFVVSLEGNIDESGTDTLMRW